MYIETTSSRLKQILKDRNLRQVDLLNLVKPLCEKYNVKMNKSDISQYVSGLVKPGQEKLFILGKALNVDEAWLMGCDVPMERNIQKETKSSNDTNPINEHEEEKDIEKIIDELMEQQGLMLCGKPMSKNSLMLLRNSIRSTLELAKSMNEEKEKNNK